MVADAIFTDGVAKTADGRTGNLSWAGSFDSGPQNGNWICVGDRLGRSWFARCNSKAISLGNRRRTCVHIGSFSQSVETTRDVRGSDEDIKADAHNVEPCPVGIFGGRSSALPACPVACPLSKYSDTVVPGYGVPEQGTRPR